MPELDMTTALGRLLARRALRDAYRRDAAATARELRIRPADLPMFLALDVSGLEAQAHTLIAKRFHEVRRLLPKTCARLGHRARETFFEFAESFWPRGHRRHGEDAVAFCDYLVSRGCGEPSPAEVRAVKFVLDGRRIALHALTGRDGIGVQILIRDRWGRKRELRLRLARRP